MKKNIRKNLWKKYGAYSLGTIGVMAMMVIPIACAQDPNTQDPKTQDTNNENDNALQAKAITALNSKLADAKNTLVANPTTTDETKLKKDKDTLKSGEVDVDGKKAKYELEITKFKESFKKFETFMATLTTNMADISKLFDPSFDTKLDEMINNLIDAVKKLPYKVTTFTKDGKEHKVFYVNIDGPKKEKLNTSVKGKQGAKTKWDGKAQEKWTAFWGTWK